MSPLRNINPIRSCAAPRCARARGFSSTGPPVRPYHELKPIDKFDDYGKPIKTPQPLDSFDDLGKPIKMTNFTRDPGTYCQDHAKELELEAKMIADLKAEVIAEFKEEFRQAVVAREKKKVAKEEQERYENEMHHEADMKWIGDEHLGGAENWIPDATKQSSS